MSEFNSKDLHRRLDLAGTLERVAKREQVREEQQEAQETVAAAAEAYRRALEQARKQEKQAPQQVTAESADARERGFRSAFAGGHRKIDLKRLREADPAAFAFLVRNTSVETA